MDIGTTALPLEIPAHRTLRPAVKPAVKTLRPAVPRTAVPKARPVTAAQPRTRTAAAERRAMKLSFRTGALFVAALTLLLFIVYSYMELNQINKTVKSNLAELQNLEKEENMLKKQVEHSISLAEVEAYAVRELGMVKPTREQVIYINLAGEDHAEVLRHSGFWGTIRNLFGTMTSHVVYFFE